MSTAEKTAEALLEAHLSFETRRWSSKQAPEDIVALVDSAWDWSAKVSLQDVFELQLLTDTAIRWVEQWYLPDSLTVIIGTLSKHLIRLPVNETVKLRDIIDEQLIDAGVDLIVELERLRENLIVQATSSPIYAMLISDVLYSGIRDYLTGENSVTQKVPGMSGLLSKGASALNKRVPGIENVLEEKLRGYISRNAQKNIQRSQKFLLETLTEQRIRDLSEQIWDSAQDAQLSISDLLDDEEIDQMVSFGLSVWQDLRQSEYLQELIREGIAAFYDAYGEESLQDLLSMLGVNREILCGEAQTVLPPLLQQAAETGLLESWLRERLKPFYQSSACLKLLT